MIVASLVSSPFFGGPERQMLGLARHLPARYAPKFLLFNEGGRQQAFLDEIERHGFEGTVLEQNTPRFGAMTREVARVLRRLGADVLCCHHYKADLVGLPAARRAGVPVISVAHGWTAATAKVRAYEALDKMGLFWMDRVVCVSQGQAAKVRAAGVPAARVAVIRNAILPDERDRDPTGRDRLAAYFPAPPRLIVTAAGRLSPEKGYDVLVEAAAIVARATPDVGFVLFGDGPLRAALARQVAGRGLESRLILAGFQPDLSRFLPYSDVFALSSHTEGLPVVVLEALAAGVPVVATAVGGTPEAVDDGQTGYLVPPGKPDALARRILDLVNDGAKRTEMGERGRARARADFTFEAQARAYQRLWDRIALPPRSPHFGPSTTTTARTGLDQTRHSGAGDRR